MIVLLSYSSSWSQNSEYPSTGGEQQTDSLVLIPISALKVANAKMIELQYQKEINFNLNQIILNDSVVIENYNKQITKLTKDNEIYVTKSKKYKTQRDCAFAGLGILLLIVLL